MTWMEIGLLWIVLSVAVPVLLGLRHIQLKEHRQGSGPRYFAPHRSIFPGRRGALAGPRYRPTTNAPETGAVTPYQNDGARIKDETS